MGQLRHCGVQDVVRDMFTVMTYVPLLTDCLIAGAGKTILA